MRLNTTSPWGTVCSRGWDIKDAKVTCRQLGFAEALAATVQSSFGTGSGHIWLDDVQCRGIENRITECPRSAWGQPSTLCRQYVSSTSYYGIAGVVCAGMSIWKLNCVSLAVYGDRCIHFADSIYLIIHTRELQVLYVQVRVL